MRRLILSVVAGYVVITAITIVSFVVLNAAGVPLNTPHWLLVKLLISLVAGALGGYTTAQLAAAAKARAVLALAGFMTVLSVWIIVVHFGSEPLWYQAALVFGAGPAVWIGGKGRGITSADNLTLS